VNTSFLKTKRTNMKQSKGNLSPLNSETDEHKSLNTFNTKRLIERLDQLARKDVINGIEWELQGPSYRPILEAATAAPQAAPPSLANTVESW